MHTKKIFLSLLVAMNVLQAQEEDSVIVSAPESATACEQRQQPIEYITIAILAKDKAHTLPWYLHCIETQTWPARKTYLYVRTNNNTDYTADVLFNWLERVGNRYAGVYFDKSDVSEQVQRFAQHEWNYERFKVLGKIRKESVDWAREHNSHYFVADCDNFIYPYTLEAMFYSNLPIVAPLLRTGNTLYSNYHAAVDKDGYLVDSPLYHDLLCCNIKGLVQVPVVHCTYFIRHDVLNQIVYDDESGRHEYVIFSDNARKKGIPQYLDCRQVYGRLTFAETTEHLLNETWLGEFVRQ